MEATTLTIIGMSSVFVFLIILVIIMYLTARIVVLLNRWFPEAEPVQENAKRRRDDEIAVAIAAVKAFQNR